MLKQSDDDYCSFLSRRDGESTWGWAMVIWKWGSSKEQKNPTKNRVQNGNKWCQGKNVEEEMYKGKKI